MERAYLDELARLLSLPDSLRESLDNQIQALPQS
ncbi:tellurite resistance TerB family protein, partial [Providencia rettgeri]|nr:tellurite resistance TerB family protein [Providencia rettgeri]